MGDRRYLLLTAVLALTLGSCGQQGTTDTPTSATVPDLTSTTTTTPLLTGTPVVIDTDMAAEGMMSILYLLAQEDLDIRAVTVSGTGLVHCESGVDQVLGLMDLMDVDGIPVACGPEEPLEGSNAFPTSWRAAADEAYGLELTAAGAESELSAPELLSSVIEESPEPVVIYADGPQTNLAGALRLDPALADNVSMAYIMGGAIDVPGNSNRNEDAEWNIWVDPVAADEVLRSGMPITLVPLDATNQVPLHVFHLRALQEHQETAAAGAVVTMLSGNEQLETGGLYFWDQLVAALIADDTYATFETENVEVVLDEDRAIAGATAVSAAGVDVRVADVVDAARFETEFLSALAETDVGTVTVDPDWTVSFDGSEWTDDLPDSATAGEYVMRLIDEGDGPAAVAFGWLTGNATMADLEALEGTAQPPFYELESLSFIGPSAETVVLVNLASIETYAVVGLDAAGNQATVLGAIEVSP